MLINREALLRKYLENIFQSITDNHFYEDAPSSVGTPYIVYEFEPTFDDGLTEVYPLVVEGWDTNPDTTKLVNLMSEVDNTLHRLRGNVGGIFFTFYRTSRRPLRDPNKKIKRRQIEFEIRVMGGNR